MADNHNVLHGVYFTPKTEYYVIRAIPFLFMGDPRSPEKKVVGGMWGGRQKRKKVVVGGM